MREGDALERLAAVKKIAFDKTGTLTYGAPKVIAVKSVSASFTEHALYAITAAAEQLSEHPLGKAVVASYKREHQAGLAPSDAFAMLPGRGVCASIQGREVLAGNLEMLVERGIAVDAEDAAQYLEQGCTVIYVAIDSAFAGYLALSDTIRPESADMIERLGKTGVQPVLLTGDGEKAANTIAKQLNISEVRSNCLPEDKLAYIDQDQDAGNPVCMIGDGINDAPALKKAAVGIAMGGVGSDIAVEAADIALVDDEVKELPHLVALSRRMMTTIKINLTFSMGLNFLAIFLAMDGILNPVVGALVHNAGSVLVIINSALLLKWRKKSDL